MPMDYETYSICRSRKRRSLAQTDRLLDLQLSVIALMVFAFALSCAIYGAYWG